ncbi:MAG: coproporphyrinogen III oxidase family protein, partial [Dehalococcoidia bacterium]
LTQWQRSLKKALSLEPEHVSLYALTVEEETPLARRIAEGGSRAPDEDAQAEMYAWSEEALAVAGYEHYEISNWARPSRRCRHNLTYWWNDPYLGLGAGAHSFLGRCRFANEKRPDVYIERVAGLTPSTAGTSGSLVDPAAMPQVAFIERLDSATALADAMILGLRLTEGIPLKAFGQRFGTDLEGRYAGDIADLSGLGLLEQVDGFLRLTARGRLLANEAFQRFLP